MIKGLAKLGVSRAQLPNFPSTRTLGNVLAAVCTPAGVPMPSWNSSAVHVGKLHTNSRRRQSTPAIRQSAEDDRSAVSTGQLWSSVFRCCGPVDLEFAAKQS